MGFGSYFPVVSPTNLKKSDSVAPALWEKSQNLALESETTERMKFFQ